MDYEDWMGYDVGSFCSCKEPEGVFVPEEMNKEKSWCRRCSRPCIRAGSEGSPANPIMIPFGRWI